MAETMIERVARKLCSLAGNPENTQFEGKPMWRSYVDEARAIVGAMRSGTPAVHAAIDRTIGDGMNYGPFAWHAAIDAALAEEV